MCWQFCSQEGQGGCRGGEGGGGGGRQQTCLEAFPNDVGFRVAGLAGGWLVHMHLMEEGPQQVEGTDGGVLKEGEGLQDEAAPGGQDPKGRHHLTEMQGCSAHLLQERNMSNQKAKSEMPNQMSQVSEHNQSSHIKRITP